MINASESAMFPSGACPQPLVDQFRHHLAALHTVDGLVECVLDISMISFDDVDRRRVQQFLSEQVSAVRSRYRGTQPRAIIAYLHEILFEEAGFRGCDNYHYYFPVNNFLSYVIESRQGLPILLSLIYKVVGAKLGLQVEGLLAPARFLIRVHDGYRWMIVDPFDGGRCLSVAETAQLIAQLTDEPDIGPQTTFPVASHAAWISRILTNLARSFDMLGSAAERDAALELLGYVRLSPHA